MVRPGSPARGQRPGLRRPPRVVLPPPGTQGLHVRPRVSSWLRGAWASGRRHTRGTRAHGLQGTAGPRPEEPLASGLANPTRGGGLGPAPGPSCPRQEAPIIEATEQGHPLRGRASSSRGHSRYRGAAGCGRAWGQRGPGAFPPGFPVYAAGPAEEARKRYLPRGHYLAGRPLRFSRAFLSLGFHGDPGGQETRPSFRQLCEGKQEAGGREAGQHRLLPPASRADSGRPAEGLGAPGVEAWAAPGLPH